MTPAKAIKIECGVCRRNQGPCTSKHCALNKAGKPLSRIERHCLTCSPHHKVKDCPGYVIGTQAAAYNSLYRIPMIDGKAECPLYPFRYGKNPNLRRVLSAEQKSAIIERTRKGRFQKKEAFSQGKGIESQAGAGIGQI